MINCYQPFRMLPSQARTIERLSLKYKVNKSWLIRYLMVEGLASYDPSQLKIEAASDTSSAQKLRKNKIGVD